MKQLTVVAQTLLVAGVIVLGSSHAFAKSREAVAHKIRPSQIVWPVAPTYFYNMYPWARPSVYGAPWGWAYPAGYYLSPGYGWPEVQALRAIVRMP
jgi:hypothetical protein